MVIHDIHCHFLSRRLFEVLAEGLPEGSRQGLPEKLGWEPPGKPEELATRWVEELDAQEVGRAALIASVPSDEDSVAAAVALHPQRLVGFFMLDPTQPDTLDRLRRALGEKSLRGVCLFPAMQRYSLHEERVLKVFEIVSGHPGTVVFVHCGVLTVGVRKKLGLASRFDIRFGNPLDLHPIALTFPQTPIIIPHFGAGMFREALMVADLCPNILLDTSSSNSWMKYHPGLTLAGVFRQALEVAGPDRLLFGTDSSFFPRGWQRVVYDAQMAALEEIGAAWKAKEKIFGQNFDRLFPETAVASAT